MLNSLEICNKLGCFDDHRENIDHFYKYFIAGLRESTEPFVFNRPKKFVLVPGWNKHCKYLRRQARDAFKVWVHSGKIRVGPVCEKMKESRGEFVRALKFCRRNEKKISDERLLEDYKNKHVSQFW